MLRLRSAILATFPSFQFSSTAIASLISLLTLAASGTELNTYNVFVVVALLSTIRVSVCENIAKGAFCVGEFVSSLERIQAFLELEELPQLVNKQRPDSSAIDVSRESLSVVAEAIESESSSSSSEKSLLTDYEQEKMEKNQSEESPKERRSLRMRKTKGSGERSIKVERQVSINNIICHWNKDSTKPTLKNISFEAFNGELILVTGPVGCGKSSLLSAILGELPVTSGDISCSGKLVHVSQSPWVFSGTIRSNILFGKRYDPRRYEAVIDACDLRKDMNSFPDRDATRIGERGTLLSGGQRTRVALARAVYADADIYLLDDPLGAVDSKVGRNLFERCIQGILGKKIRIVVTHQLQVRILYNRLHPAAPLSSSHHLYVGSWFYPYIEQSIE